jgi:tetratricopeptide (TPR) repeat protein
VVGPWTLRNYLLYQRVIPIDTLGQINLWLDLDRVEDRTENIETLRGMPQADRHVYALARAREILSEDPMRPFRPMWSTFRHIWKAQYVEDFFVKQSFFGRTLRESAPLGLIGDALWFTFTLAGVIGLALPMRERLHNRLFFLAWLGYSFLTVLVFHVEPRYLVPIWTLFALYGAGALAKVKGKKQKVKNDIAQRPRFTFYLLPFTLAVSFLALVLTYRDYPALLSRGFARENAIVAGERAYARGDYTAAEQAFREALAAHPDFVDTQVSLALSLAAQGRRDKAAALLTQNASRQNDLVIGALARDAGDMETARKAMRRVEAIAGQDVQRWTLEWLRPPPTNQIAIGGGLDLGYISGFSIAEADSTGGFRWLEGDGQIVLPLEQLLKPGATLELRLTGGPTAEQTPLEVRIGDAPGQRIDVARGQWRMYRLAVPPALVGQQRVTIRLRAPMFVPARFDPASADARALSLMVSSVRIK